MQMTMVILTVCPSCGVKISCSHFIEDGRRQRRVCKDCILSFLVGKCFDMEEVIVIKKHKLCPDCIGFQREV